MLSPYRSLVWIALFAVACAVPVEAGEVHLIDGIPHVRNGDQAPREVVQLKELWRVGGEDEEILFGVINRVLDDERGNFYLLDHQLSQVHVYSPNGEYLRTIVQEGEGPGEVRRPAAMVMLPGEKLGVVQAFPAQITVVDLQGIPAGTITPGGDRSAGGFDMIQEIEGHGDYLAAVGHELRQSSDGFERTRYLATFGPDGREKHRLLEETSPDRVVTGKYVEKDEYFVDHGKWTMGPDGKLYTAETRDRYRISVYAHTGELLRVIERDFTPPKRTAEEKASVGEGLLVVVNGERVQIEAEPEDCPPCIERMYVDDDRNLWVRNSWGTRDQEAGIMETWDVFDPEGHFIRQAAFACEGDPEEDRLTFTGNARAFLLKGIFDAARAQIGDAAADPVEEASVMQVICYAI